MNVRILRDEAPHPEVIDVAVLDRLAGVGVVHDAGERDLAQVTSALDLLGLGFRGGQGGQEHPRQDRNDGDHHEKFD